MIYPMNNTMTKRLAALAWVMLLANVFLPTGVAFAEEGAPIVPEQVKSQETEKVSNEQWENLDNQESQVKVLDQIAEELPNQEIPAEMIVKWGMNVEESSTSSTLVKYFTIGSDDEIPLLMKEDWTVDYKATQGQYPDTVQWYLKEKSQVVDFWWEKVIFNKWGYPLFEKKDSIYREALKVIKPGSPSLEYDLDASLKGEWTSLDSFVKYAEVKNSAAKIIWYFLLKANFDFVYAPVAGEARIGNQGFLTLQEAIASASDEDTILLTKDISAGKALYTTAVGAHVCTAGSSEQKTTWPKKVTIDFQGHTYNVADAVGSCGTESQAAHFEKWSEITLKNWTLTSNNAHVHMIIQNYSKLTLENFTLDAADLERLPVYAISNNFWELNVHGDSHINAGEWGIAFDLWYWDDSSYDAGVSVKFASDFVGSVDGDIEYGPANRVKTTPNWEEKALLSIEGNGKFNWTIKASNGNDLKKANITVKWGLFSNDVALYTVSDKCSIKNADSKYEVKDCPVATNFYTSNKNPIPVVLDGTNLNLEETKAVLKKNIDITKPENAEIKALMSLNSVENTVEVKEVGGEKLLFVNVNKIDPSKQQTQVYREKIDGIFGANAFKNNTETEGKSADISFDLKNAIAPSWVDKNEAIKSYNVVMTGGKEIWYTLHTKEKFGRFYAPKNYTITFDTNGGSKVEKITQGYGTAVTAPANPTRRCHRFRWWRSDIPVTMPAENITLKAQWSNTCGGDGWGGSSSSVSSSSVTTWTTSSVNTWANQPVKPKVEVRNYSWDALPSLCSAEGSSFSEEQNQAYLWACGKDITTIRAISGARLDHPLTRAELAKMMSVYVTKVLGKQPVLTGVAQYPDVDSKMGDLADYIQLAYQLQIMGIHHDGTALSHFEPNKFVTRAEFATVFSRVLYGAKYNQDGKDWAKGHLNALKEAGILKNITPNMLELRGRVLLMLQRSTVAK